MTPKEYAKHLIYIFKKHATTSDYDFEVRGALDYNFNAKNCAKLCIYELLKNKNDEKVKTYLDKSKDTIMYTTYNEYYTDVLNEIDNY